VYSYTDPISKLEIEIAEYILHKMEVSTMNLSKILNLVYRYLWLLVLAALLASLTTLFQLGTRPVAYRATTDLLIGPGLDSPSPDLNSLKIGGQLGQTYAEVLTTGSFLEAVNNKLDQKIDLNKLKGAISSNQSTETRVLTIIVNYADPKQAVAIANAAAQTLLEMSPSKDNITTSLRAQLSDQSHQLEQVVSESQANIKQLEAELTALKVANTSSPVAATANLEKQNLAIKQLADERSRFSDSLRTLTTIYQILLDTNTNQMQIIQPATAATIVDRQLWLRVFASGVGGLIFALIIVFVAEYFDDRIRFPGELSRATGVPLLSTIEKYDASNGFGSDRLVAFAQPESDAANGYREVVAKLLFSIGESIPYTLLLSSVGSKTGTDAAVTAGNLAVAFAQSNYKVVLVDAQFDNPVLTTMFNAERAEGLANLMVTKSSEPQLLAVEQVPGVRFLPAGSSSERSSHTMLNPTNVTTLLEQLQKEADIVIVADSAISRLAENLTLASRVNAVILVARQAEARSKAVNNVVQSFRLMKINLAGVIFDYNPSSFSSKDNRKIGSALGRGNSGEVLQKGTLSEQTTEG
jgi:capsular polysaccharide biosynthesis protein/Mrp family chromosome partitioning ATPase